jgi:hypothetical protein
VERKVSHPKGNPTKPAPSKDHFERLLDAPCTHHEVPVKHSLKDCRLIKNYVNGTLKPRMADPPKKGGLPPDNDDGAGAMYPGEDGAVHMIFGGSLARPSRRREKLILREVFNADTAKPSYLKWSEVPITFDRKDHPDHVPQPGSYPLVVAPLFKSKRIHKVLMDGESGINVLYASTLDDMGIPRSQLRPSTAPFHEVVPGMEALPIRQIDLPITFGDLRNFRTKTLTFEVVGFSGTYHAILGRPAYVKFMAVPNYTYLKLKIPGPKGIITVGTTYQCAFEFDAECFQFADALIWSKRLHAEPPSEDQDVPESSKRAACSFDPAKDVKDAAVSDDGRTLRIGTALDPKQESTLVDFLKANLNVFAWKPSDMKEILREVAEHKLNIKPGSKPVKQRLRRFNDGKCKAIGEEIVKLLSTGFIREVFHPEWHANPVLVIRRIRNGGCVLTTRALTRHVPRIRFLCLA